MFETTYAAAIECHRNGQLASAAQLYRQVLEINPRHADSLHLLGLIAYQTGQHQAAADAIRKAIDINPHESSYHCNFGNALLALGQADDAAAHYEQALKLRADSPEAHMNLGNVLQELGRTDEAIIRYEQALALRPGYAEAHANLGDAFLATDKLPEAVRQFEQALALKPHFVEALMNLGNTLQRLGRLDEAGRHYERAVTLKPDNAELRVNLAHNQLRRGDFRAGWQSYEWRWRLDSFALSKRHFAQPQWHGEPLHGQRIFLYGEQGLGDCIQFLRYLPLVQAAGGAVVLEVPAPLRRITAELPGIADLITPGDSLPAFEWHCPLLSLPLAFGTNRDNIPAAVPYLLIPDETCKKAASYEWPKNGLRVGLVWAGNRDNPRDRCRSVALSLLRPLFGVKRVSFFSLQTGEAADQLGTVDAQIFDLASQNADMADTAAQIAHLDLVISVDTSVAHLAGALGKPVWLLLSSDSDWRWLSARQDSPWYPTARLFRQAAFGDWSSAIDCLASSLLDLAARS